LSRTIAAMLVLTLAVFCTAQNCHIHTFTNECKKLGNVTNISVAYVTAEEHAALNHALLTVDNTALDAYNVFRSFPHAPHTVNSTACRELFIQSHCIFFNDSSVPLCFTNGTVGALPCWGSCVSYYMACFGESLENATEPCEDFSAAPGDVNCYGTTDVA